MRRVRIGQPSARRYFVADHSMAALQCSLATLAPSVSRIQPTRSASTVPVRRRVATGGIQRDEPESRPMLFRCLLLYSGGTGETLCDGGTLLRMRRLGVRIPPSAQKCLSQAAEPHLIFGPAKFGTQVGRTQRILTRPETRLALGSSTELSHCTVRARQQLIFRHGAGTCPRRIRPGRLENGRHDCCCCCASCRGTDGPVPGSI
jgi:hypothetical protein